MDRRAALIDELRAHVTDERVLAAIGVVPRERFLVPRDARHAYENRALPIACGQTISQPLVVARMTELLQLRPDDRVLDVGTGSGYHAAVLAQLCTHVWSIERVASLSEQASRNLRACGTYNVTLLVGDGTRGAPSHAPFDAINVAASGPLRLLAELERQLASGGRMIAPVAGPEERLMLVRRAASRKLSRQVLEPVRFVRLVDDT